MQNFTDVCIVGSTKRLDKLVDFGDLYANKTYIVVVDVVVKRSRKECQIHNPAVKEVFFFLSEGNLSVVRSFNFVFLAASPNSLT